MKVCQACNALYQECVMSCQRCKGQLKEVTLAQVLELTKKGSFQKHITGDTEHVLSDPYKQYHIRSYLQDRSLFLEFDLYKNRLKHGSRLKKFFIAPVNATSVINLPWFFFNVIASNMFQMEHSGYCARCNSKYIPGKHTPQECDYNIEYFHILDDILSGEIVGRKAIYLEHSKELAQKGAPSAYADLFCRQVRAEAFLDLLSIGLSVLFWIYIAVNISWPWFQVLLQQLNQIEAYEFGLPVN